MRMKLVEKKEEKSSCLSPEDSCVSFLLFFFSFLLFFFFFLSFFLSTLLPLSTFLLAFSLHSHYLSSLHLCSYDSSRPGTEMSGAYYTSDDDDQGGGYPGGHDGRRSASFGRHSSAASDTDYESGGETRRGRDGMPSFPFKV
jgi:hypothetical protein